MQGSGHPPRDGLGRSGRRARKNAGIWVLPCAGARKNAGIRTRRVSGSSCTGAWPAWWRRPGHSETSTSRERWRGPASTTRSPRCTCDRRPRSPFCARSCAGTGKNAWIRAPPIATVLAGLCAGLTKMEGSGHSRARGFVIMHGCGHPPLGIPVRGGSKKCMDPDTPCRNLQE